MTLRQVGGMAVGAALTTLVACSRSAGDPRDDAGANASSAPAVVASAAPIVVSAPPVQAGSMAPSLRAVGDTLLLTWIERLDGTAARGGSAGDRHRVRFARFSAGAWGAPTTIAEGKRIVANWADVPSVAAAVDGTLVAHWAEKSGDATYAYDVVMGRSTDGGASWKRLGLAHDDGTPTEHGFVSLVPEGDRVRAFWLDGRETAGGKGAMTLRTALVTQAGVGQGEVVDERVCDCCRTAAAVTSSGPIAVYRDRTAEEVRDMAVVRRGGDGWSEPASVNADGWNVAGCPVNGPAVAAAGKRVAVAWFTYAEQRGRVRLALSEDGGEHFSSPITVDEPAGRRAPIGRVDVALDAGGAIVSWIASDREDAELLVARVATDGRRGDALTVTKTRAGRDSGFPRFVRLGDALAFVWTEPGERSFVRLRQVPVSELASPSRRERTRAPADTALVSPGQPAPELTARDLEGQTVKLSALRGKPVLLNLWATWCEPCRLELRELKRLHERYAAKGLTVLAVSVDRERTPAQLQKLVGRRKLPFTVWHDREDRASGTFRVATLPATFLIDRHGEIAWAHAGAITADHEGLAGALDAAIAEGRR